MNQSEQQPEQKSEQQWWDAPGMPWKKKPTRAEIICLFSFSFVAIFGFAMMPVRAWFLGDASRLPWMVAILGSYTGATGLGALRSVGEQVPIIWPVLFGGISLIKFDWLYWWAGKLWGRGLIEVWSGQSERAARRFAKVEKFAQKIGWLGIFISYIPIPLPIAPVVYVLAGANNMSLKKFLIIDYISAVIWRFGYIAFGFWIGEPAVDLLKVYSQYANYVAIALVFVVVFGLVMRSNKAKKS